ncbi:MAG: class I tRNA ligase family protein, partial [Nanoarchaeota archaeon]
VNGEKMSKSRGTFLTARQYLDKVDPEFLRLYYSANLGKKLVDIDLDEKDFIGRINNELVGNIANFAYRVLSFLNKNFDSKIIAVQQNAITVELDQLHSDIERDFEQVDFKEAYKKILHYSSIGNKYFQENEPWVLIKDDKEATHEVLSLSVNIVKNLCILLKPILPKKTAELEAQLNLKDLKWKDLGFSLGAHEVGQAKALVKKLEDANLFEVVSPFSKLNIKVGSVLSVEDHPDAEKLYVLKVRIGEEERQIVAGLKPYHPKEDLLGKSVYVITNLEHARLRGEKSEGMLLAADDGE